MVDPEPLHGYMLAKSKTLTLLQVFNWDFMDFNGYTVLRNRDITRTFLLGPGAFVSRALALKGVEPTPVEGIDIESWRSLIRTASASFPVITIHQEVLEACFIGRLSLISENSFGLTEIDPGARWNRARSYRFEDLTKVDFGGGYEAALVAVSEMEAKPKKSGAKNRKSSPRVLRAE